MTAQIIDFMPYLEKKRQQEIDQIMQVEFTGLSFQIILKGDDHFECIVNDSQNN